MAGRGRGPDVASVIRGSFLRAIKSREPENLHHNNKTVKSLTDIMYELLDENPIGLLNAVKGYIPKELEVAIEEVTHEAWLEELEKRDAEPPES